MVQLLLKWGVDLEARTAYGWTPLHVSSIRGNTSVVQSLLANGAKVEAKTRWPALFEAIVAKNTRTVQLLSDWKDKSNVSADRQHEGVAL